MMSDENDLSSPAAEDREDRENLFAAGRGDQQAFACLVQKYQQAIYGFVVQMLGGVDGAEDLVQESFLRLWRSAPRWKPQASVRSYLFLISRRVVYNECRRKKRKPFTSLEQISESRVQPLEPVDFRPDAVDIAACGELADAIEKAMLVLPEQQRCVLELSRYHSFSYEEISLQLGISVASVKSLLWRARGKLKQELHEWLGEG